MTVAELIQKLQSLNVDPETPINFFVNDFDAAKVKTIEARKYIRTIPSDGSWKTSTEIDFHLHSDTLEG